MSHLIGILALQGNYDRHSLMLASMGLKSKLVKYSDNLDGCSGLIIPGGESTSISKLINSNGLKNGIINFSKKQTIFGSCAGMILLSSNSSTINLDPLQIMDFKIDRNGWGSQINSFCGEVSYSIGNNKILGNGAFIRAPKVKSIGEKINIIGKFEKEYVCLSDGRHIASAFHPELTNCTILYKLFVDMIHEKEA